MPAAEIAEKENALEAYSAQACELKRLYDRIGQIRTETAEVSASLSRLRRLRIEILLIVGEPPAPYRCLPRRLIRISLAPVHEIRCQSAFAPVVNGLRPEAAMKLIALVQKHGSE